MIYCVNGLFILGQAEYAVLESTTVTVTPINRDSERQTSMYRIIKLLLFQENIVTHINNNRSSINHATQCMMSIIIRWMKNRTFSLITMQRSVSAYYYIIYMSLHATTWCRISRNITYGTYLLLCMLFKITVTVL